MTVQKRTKKERSGLIHHPTSCMSPRVPPRLEAVVKNIGIKPKKKKAQNLHHKTSDKQSVGNV